VTREPRPGIALELPRIDYGRRNGTHYRYAYGIASADGGFPVFVQAPGTNQEDSGVLLSVVLAARAFVWPTRGDQPAHPRSAWLMRAAWRVRW
jgi:hypothetical protein